jgi:hypothetical protein
VASSTVATNRPIRRSNNSQSHSQVENGRSLEKLQGLRPRFALGGVI